MSISRRKLVVVGSALALSGCLGDEESPEEEPEEETESPEPEYSTSVEPVEYIPESISNPTSENFTLSESRTDTRVWNSSSGTELHVNAILSGSDEEAQNSYFQLLNSQARGSSETVDIADQGSFGLDSEGWPFIVFKHHNLVGVVVVISGDVSDKDRIERVARHVFEHWQSS